jgi:hypothetical protein
MATLWEVAICPNLGMHSAKARSGTLQALNAVEFQVNFLREARNSVSARIGVVFFWAFMGGVLGPNLQNLLSFPEPHDDLFIALGMAVGCCIGAYAAFAGSRLAVLLAFPAILFWLLPF